MSLSRRSLMFGAASLATSAFIRRLVADPAPAPPRRLVLIMQNNGTQQANFWPRAGFTSPILEPLLLDPRIAARTCVVRGVYLPFDAFGTFANEHDMGFARMFTGEKLLNVGGAPWGGGPSIDQIVARAWRSETLNLAVLASRDEPYPKPGLLHRRSFSYLAAGTIKLPIEDPLVAYTRHFALPGELDEAARHRLLLQKSALDVVTGELRDLRGQLPGTLRDKLDLHAESVRTLEQELGRTLDGNLARCDRVRPQQPRDYTGTAPEQLVYDERAIPDLVTSMIDLIAAGITCAAPPICTLQLGYGGGKWHFGWEGIHTNVHEVFAHRDTSDAGSSPENTAKLVTINRWYASQVAQLAKRLDQIPEGTGTVLDHTLIVWANEFARGDHSLENIPIVLVGGGGGFSGGRLVDAGRQPFQRLGCTILRAMGLPVSGFGDAPDCGPLVGL